MCALIAVNPASEKPEGAQLVADPNPVSGGFGLGRTTIRWATGGAPGQIFAAEGNDPEIFFAEGTSGAAEAPWIRAGICYHFHLYEGLAREKRIASLEVNREELSPELIASALADYLRINPEVAAETIATVLRPWLDFPTYQTVFRGLEKNGIHLTPVHFYQPLPDTSALPAAIWDRISELPGLEMNAPSQRRFLQEVLPVYRDEYMSFPKKAGKPGRFYFGNQLFDYVDAAVLYSIVRHFRPRRIVEVGSGYSTLVSAAAAKKNRQTELIAIEPYPEEYLKRGVPGLDRLIVKPVQEIDLEFFAGLGSGDILFVDTAHVVKIGGDVNYLFLEVIPRLAPGVIVHVHDIFFPKEYKRSWVVDEFRFWNEQYLLQAFLAFNDQFEVLVSNSYLCWKFPSELENLFQGLPWREAGSFWMRRRDGKTRSGPWNP